MKRILCLILAILMVGSVAMTLVYNLLITRVYAADAVSRMSFSAEDSTDSIKIRTGLMYGQNVTIGFEVTSPYGFGIVLVDTSSNDLSATELTSLTAKKVSVTVDANLAKTDMTYRKASGSDRTVIGGYHIEVGAASDAETCMRTIAALDKTLSEMGLQAFPFRSDESFFVRIGSFESVELVSTYSAKIAAVFPDLDLHSASPSDSAVSVVDPETDTILFEFDSASKFALGLSASPSPDGERAYLVTPAKKMYDGIFMFRRNLLLNGTVDGVALTNVISLNDYIEGVLPYEISNSWPLESQKAFAICVRSYTLASLCRHEKYGFDLCNSAHCQVYQGRARVNSAVEQAVRETTGKVMTYNGKIATAFYSAVSGGVTVSSKDAWYEDIPYLRAVETPWEIYTNHPYGTWQTEVSGKELADYLRAGGYNVSGTIKSVNIDKLADNSTYIVQLSVTDSYGNTITIKKSDTIRSALAKYVKSANFVIGKGSVEADVTTFDTGAVKSTSVMTSNGEYSVENSENISVITASGTYSADTLKDASAVTSIGRKQLGEVTSVTTKQVFTASSSDNFIIVGKGYGHGVGLSQIGLRDLADQGVPAEKMLGLYCTGVEILNWRDLLN